MGRNMRMKVKVCVCERKRIILYSISLLTCLVCVVLFVTRHLSLSLHQRVTSPMRSSPWHVSTSPSSAPSSPQVMGSAAPTRSMYVKISTVITILSFCHVLVYCSRVIIQYLYWIAKLKYFKCFILIFVQVQHS